MTNASASEDGIGESLRRILAVTIEHWWPSPPAPASVHGVDATKPLTAEQLRALQSALCEQRMLLIYGRHLDDAQLVDFLCGLVTASQAAWHASSVLYAETVPRAGSDAIWIRLASACDRLDAGVKRQIGQVQLIVYNTFLRRFRMLPAHG